MRRPQADPCRFRGWDHLVKELSPFKVDIELQDGQVFDLGTGPRWRLWQLRGTPDHHSFYRRRKIFDRRLTAGVPVPTPFPEFVSDYDTYLSSLQRLAVLPVEVYCQGTMPDGGRGRNQALF